MHSYHLLEILAVGFGVALLFGYLAQRARLSPIVGYLAAGFLIGPLTPGFVADADLANNLAEAGIILLMFGVGLHFNTDDLMEVKGIAIPGAAVQCAASAAFGLLAALAMGYSPAEGVFLGLGLSVASTVVLLRVLTDSGRLDSAAGTIAVGWLVVEDIFTVLMLVLLPAVGPSLAAGGSFSLPALLWAVCAAGAKLVILWGLVMTAGSRAVPWALKHIVRTRSRELFTLTVLSAAFLTALAAAYIFGASFALGAFLGGMVPRRHGRRKEPRRPSGRGGAHSSPGRFLRALLPLRGDALQAVFPAGAAGACRSLPRGGAPREAPCRGGDHGGPAETAFTVAAGLAQVGEFSFILAQTGLSLGLISEDIYSVLIVCALASIAVNPFLMNAVPAALAAAKRFPSFWGFLNARAERHAAAVEVSSLAFADEMTEGKATVLSSLAFADEMTEGKETVLIAGYGPAGQLAAEAAEQCGFAPVILEMNMDTVLRLEEEGKAAVYGDITKEDVLRAAGAGKASRFNRGEGDQSGYPRLRADPFPSGQGAPRRSGGGLHHL